MSSLKEFVYREERYKASFSLVLIYSNDGLRIAIENLQDELRETDKVIPLEKDLVAVIFDAATNESYVKAAENLNKTLQKIHFQEKFFFATADSEEFDKNYLDMTNKLFERLEYALVNNLYNTVVYQDYII